MVFSISKYCGSPNQKGSNETWLVYVFIFLLWFFCLPSLQAQNIKRKTLFTSDSIINITLSSDFKKIYKNKNDSSYHDATITFHLRPTGITENIRIKARGVQRKLICQTPSLMLNFHLANNSAIKKLGKLKLVTGCDTKSYDEQLLLKEYLVYKMYNLITDKSLRVRLLSVNYEDKKNGSKLYRQHAFIIEDTDDMARRNNCIEIERKIGTEETNRQQMTLLALFQYMIGNFDWAVPALKNIKLIVSKDQTDENPVAVPYDFDYSGIVNAGYAIPGEYYNIESVTDRVYRGFPRTMDEITVALDSLKYYKQHFNSVINDFSLLSSGNKKEMINYLEGFYKLIEDKSKVKEIFIDNARSE